MTDAASRTEIVHFAGATLRIGPVIRQRCLWCGALIEEIDVRQVAVPIEPGQTAEQAHHGLFDLKWSGLVAVDGNARYSVPDPPDGEVPARACSEVLPEL
jgi:hypothetical protein